MHPSLLLPTIEMLYKVVRRQPWKTLFIAFEVLTTLAIRLPLWLLYYIPKSNRIRPWYSYRRCVVLKLMQRLNRQILFECVYCYLAAAPLEID